MNEDSTQNTAAAAHDDTGAGKETGTYKGADFADQLCQHIPALRVYARALSRNVVDADDLVQDCLVKAMEKSHLWRAGSNLKAWLFTILRNLFINKYRRTRARPVKVSFDDHYEEQLGANPLDEKPATMHQISRALYGLPDEQREVVVLVIMHGLSYEEASEIAEVPLGTVRSRLSRARASLRLALGEREMSDLAQGESALYLAA